MARPLKELDEKQIETYASLLCSNQEIAQLMGCSTDTLERRYAAIMAKGRANRKATLRQIQWKIARGAPREFDAQGRVVREELKPNASMAIFLGKNYLGQRDIPEVELDKIEVIRAVNQARADLADAMMKAKINPYE